MKKETALKRLKEGLAEVLKPDWENSFYYARLAKIQDLSRYARKYGLEEEYRRIMKEGGAV